MAMTKEMLDYTPTEVVKVIGMENDEWLKWRTTGIGGSDVAAVYNCSPFCTKRDLYFVKRNVKPLIEEEENWVAKEYGHALEDLVAQTFKRTIGIEGLDILIPEYLYQHPLHTCMQANVDRILRFPDGKIAILECKTCNAEAKGKWDNEAIPYNYELQVRHYMAVMNIDVAYIACLWGNNESCFCYRKLERDLDFEEDMIAMEEDFWQNYVLASVEPAYAENYDLVLSSIRRFYSPDTESVVTLSEESGKILAAALELQEKKRELEREAKKIDDQMKDSLVPVLEELGSALVGECDGEDGDTLRIAFSLSSRTGVSNDMLPWLKETNPDVYDKVVTTSESRRMNMKKYKKKVKV